MSRASLFLTTAAVSVGCLGLAGLTYHVGLFIAPAVSQFLAGVPFTAAFALAKGQLVALGIDFLAILGIVTCADVILKSPPVALLVTLLLGGLTVVSGLVSLIGVISFATLVGTGTFEPGQLALSAIGAVVFGIAAGAFGYCVARFRDWAQS